MKRTSRKHRIVIAALLFNAVAAARVADAGPIQNCAGYGDREPLFSHRPVCPEGFSFEGDIEARGVPLQPAGAPSLSIATPLVHGFSYRAEPALTGVAEKTVRSDIPAPLVIAFAAFIGLVVIGRRDVGESSPPNRMARGRGERRERIRNAG